MSRPELRAHLDTDVLYGLRYLEGIPDDSDLRELKRYVEDELQYEDYKSATLFYTEFLGRPIPPEKGAGRRDKERAFVALNDRFFLLTALLHRADALHPWLYARCREVEAEPDGCLDLWARYHYKSTLGTFAGIIQEVLRNPEITVCILSCTRDIARGFLLQIQQELENNDEIKRLYPDVLWDNPAREAPRWSRDQGIVVKRRSNPKESTVEAWGLIDGQPTSRHYMLLDYDDVVTQDLVGNPETIKKVTERWELSDNLGTLASKRKWHFGTRYSFGDTYGVIVERKILKERTYPATDDGTLDGNPVLMTPEAWKKTKDAQRATIAAQMLLNPLAGNEAIFRAEWFKPYDVRPTLLTGYMMVDPSKGTGARSDRTAIILVGVDARGNRYLLDGVRHRMSLTDRWYHMRRIHKKWMGEAGVQGIKVGYERYGMLSDIDVIKDMMQREGYQFHIEELNWTREGANSKKDRVSRLEPDFRKGRFYFPAVVWHPDVADEARRRGIEGKAFWKIEQKPEGGAVIKYRPYHGATRNQEAAEATNQAYRIVGPIKAIDEDHRVYDLTRVLFEELLFFPFLDKDDAVDALSRLYDLEPTDAIRFEEGALDPVEDTHG